MKSVLISIQPKWVGKIANGEKTIEVRKTKPNLKTPFKCYIYETKAKKHYYSYIEACECPNEKDRISGWSYGCGKVIGEFTCDKIDEFKANNMIQAYYNNSLKTCLSDMELYLYGEGKTLYGLHITDLKIYDTPKDISEFKTVLNDKDIKCKYKEQRFKTYNGKPYYRCNLQNCVCEFRRLGRQTDCDGYELTRENKPLTRPPQSWCYVETL